MTALAALTVALATLVPQDGLVPVNAMERHDPRVYDVTFEVSLGNIIRYVDPRFLQDEVQRRIFAIDEAPIVLPMIMRGPYSKVAVDSMKSKLWGDGREDTTIQQRSRLDRDKPNGMQFAVLPMGAFRGREIRWQIGFRAQAWSCRVNEALAVQATWPREWPEITRDSLKPQMFVESADPVFAETVERVSGGRLRFVPPYNAAKDLVRYCINNVRVVRNGDIRREMGTLHGLDITGAKVAATSGEGTPHDLVCVCIAMLRAAGIPARPVVGVTKDEDSNNRKKIVSWGEFYLAGSGWVPFDPIEMRKYSPTTRKIEDPWRGFGTIKDLNKRVPLSYYFHPPADLQAPEFPGVWGWDPRPAAPQPLEQRITLLMITRGRGVEDG